MNLLIVAIEDQEHVEDFLSALVDLGVDGLQITESTAVMEFLARETPVFAGLRQLMTRPKAESKTVLGVTEDEQVLRRLKALLRKVEIDLDRPGVGYALLLPLTDWTGHLEPESEG